MFHFFAKLHVQVPAEAIKERCKQVRDFVAEAMKIPGFLVIDTPGHESFSLVSYLLSLFFK